MSKGYLNPKTVSPDAWKQWARDTMVMMRRLGAFGLVGMPVLLMGMALGLATLTHGKHPVIILLGSPISLAFGLFFMTIAYQMMARARRGEDPSPIMDIMAGIADVIDNSKWYLRTLFSALVVLVIVMLVLLLFVFLVSMLPDEGAEAPARASTLTDTAVGVLSQITLWVWIMRPRGLMSMSYFFGVREKVDAETSARLERLGQQRNISLASASMMLFLVGMASLIVYPMFGILGSVIVNLMVMFMAGINICAWHDIYDPDEGLAVKEKQHALELGRVSA